MSACLEQRGSWPMDIKPIKTEADYEAALKDIDRLMDAKLDTPEGDQHEPKRIAASINQSVAATKREP